MKSLYLPNWDAFLRYEELAGEDPVNVYLAGLVLASQATFVSIVVNHPTLAAHRSIYVDLLGSGFSDAPEDFSYSIEDHAGIVATFLDELNLKDCNLVGYSMAGAVAITLASTRPHLVARLVLMEANLDPIKPGEGKVSSGIANQTEEEFCDNGFQTLVDSFRQTGIEGDHTLGTMAGILQVAAPHAVHRGAVSLVQGTQPSTRNRLLEMTIPRAYIFGERSLPDPKWDVLASHGVRVLAVPNAGHGMAWDNPGGVAEALETALTT